MADTIEWQIVRYEPSRRGSVLSLMAFVQGHETSAAEFVWWFEKNPVRCLDIFLAECDSRVIGVASTNSFRVWCGGGEDVVPFALNVLSHPEYRGRGVFSALELATEEEARRQGRPFMLSFPNAASTPIFLNRLGWRRGRVAPLMLKVARFDALLSLAPGLALGRRLAAALNPVGRRWFRRQIPAAVEAIGEFGDEFDRLWVQERASRRWGLVRDSTHLNWRYVQAPSKRYRCHRVLDGGRTVGYVVSGVIEKKGLRWGFVADLFVARGAAHRYADALATVDALLFREDIDAVVCFAPSRWQDLVRHLGFVYLPTPKRFNFIYKVLDAQFDALPFADASRWEFHLGDTDFF